MTPKKIIALIETYEAQLEAQGIPKRLLDPKRTFESSAINERLAHAHYLCEGVKRYAGDPALQHKTISVLTSIQLCLSYAGWYTIEGLAKHTMPDPVEWSEKPVQGSDFGVSPKFT